MAATRGGFLWWCTQRSWSLTTQSSYDIGLQSVTHVHLGFLPSLLPSCLPSYLPSCLFLSGRACHYFTPGRSENISRCLGITQSPTADKPAAGLGWHHAAERAVFARCCLCPVIPMGSMLEQHRQLSCSAHR